MAAPWKTAMDLVLHAIPQAVPVGKDAAFPMLTKIFSAVPEMVVFPASQWSERRQYLCDFLAPWCDAQFSPVLCRHSCPLSFLYPQKTIYWLYHANLRWPPRFLLAGTVHCDFVGLSVLLCEYTLPGDSSDCGEVRVLH